MSMCVTFIHTPLSLHLFLLPPAFLSLFWPAALFFSGLLVAFWPCYPDVIIFTAIMQVHVFSQSFGTTWSFFACCHNCLDPSFLIGQRTFSSRVPESIYLLPAQYPKKPGQTTQWLFQTDRQTDRQRLEPNLAHSTELHSLNWSRHKSKFGIMYLQSGLQRYFLGHL